MTTDSDGYIKAFHYRSHGHTEHAARQRVLECSMEPGFLVGWVCRAGQCSHYGRRPALSPHDKIWGLEFYVDADLPKEHPSGREEAIPAKMLVRDPEFYGQILAGDGALEEVKQKVKEREESAALEARERSELDRLKTLRRREKPPRPAPFPLPHRRARHEAHHGARHSLWRAA